MRGLGAVVVLAAAMVAGLTAQGQVSRWAAADDPTAKMMIEAERKWAEAGCTPNGIEKSILAEDFHGVSPEGEEYSKKDMVAEAGTSAPAERGCVMYGVKVHYFGANMAVLYGSESAIVKGKDGKEFTRKLTWVDTWLKRDGKWQIVAAEDLPTVMK